jgi:hypothetical protein
LRGAPTYLVRVADGVARDDRLAEHAELDEVGDVRQRRLPPVRVDAVELQARVRRQIPRTQRAIGRRARDA